MNVKIRLSTIILSLICVGTLVALPFLDYSTVKFQGIEKPTIILNLIHIDEFEGGQNSRGGFLKKVAEQFTKKNSGVYLEVKNASIEELSLLLKTDVKIDLISFSIGVGEMVFPRLKQYTGAINFRDDFTQSGKSGSSQYAVPWCAGGYCLIGANGKKPQTTLCGESRYSNPYPAAHDTGIKVGERLSQSDAYQRFLAAPKEQRLLGTQRDIIRVGQKIKQGKLENMEISPLGITDLVQYIALASDNQQNSYYAQKYIEYLTSETVQRTLSSIAMINVLGESYYDGGDMAALEHAIKAPQTLPNVFLPIDSIVSQREAARKKCL